MGEGVGDLYASLFKRLRGKRIGIYGLGREGRSSLEFMLRHQDDIEPARILCADDRVPTMDEALTEQLQDPLVHTFFVDHVRMIFDESDIVLISPGVAILDQEIELRDGYYRFSDWPHVAITSQIDLFLRDAPGHLIGITGTKGKSTTTSVLSALLNASGCKTVLAGNIGVPIWDVWAEMTQDSYAAIELSSHQLQYCCSAPEIFTITNLYPEHLDHYHSYDEYVNAKMNGLRFCSADESAGPRADRVPTYVLNLMDEDLVARSLPLINEHKPRVITVRKGRGGEDPDINVWKHLAVEDGILYDLDQPDTPLLDLTTNVHLLGKHLRFDAALASACLIAAELPLDNLAMGLGTFEGLRHRTEKIGTYHGIEFYNDSIATIPQATLLAIEALGDRVKTLIVGGMSRGLDFTEFAQALKQTSVETVICMPETGQEIMTLLEKEQGSRRFRLLPAATIEEAVKLSYVHTTEGAICLLSPAASSYNAFKNFEERGDAFRTAVLNQSEDLNLV